MSTFLTMHPALAWATLAAILLIAEVVNNSFVFAFFSVGAALVAMLTGLAVTSGIDSQLLVFALVSVGAMVVFRQRLRGLFAGSKQNEYVEFIGDRVTVTQTIPPQGLGRVQYRGTEWSARTETGKTHRPGEGTTIRRVEGIVLVVD
ncbi:NfeD family protein [Fibrella sp. WM1]|uniref:NfeD family protein n=1 Tax=Fibrella musci TaxID=3242485 RepID=UPI00352287A5